MSAIREAIEWLRRMQWTEEQPAFGTGRAFRCRGCGTLITDRVDGYTRAGHYCSLSRTIEEASREVTR